MTPAATPAEIPGSDPAAPSTPPLLSCRGVTKSFGAATVLAGIDLDVATHRVVALIGASGSGKSTLLRCVDLLETVDDGVITLAGQDITDPRVDANRIRAGIGVVFQAFNLFPHRSVLDNITLAPRTVHGVDRDEAEARAFSLLDRIGLADRAREFPDRLSGGQQQRVAIVRALAYDPALLLFDEITSALDPELVGEVLELVRELADGGATILMATHEMGFARRVADTVCFLDGGRLLESGPPEQVLADPKEARTRQFLARVIAAGRL